jgi:VIT1/CCC1 family predicted Fe2+/Mn2+ transporter
MNEIHDYRTWLAHGNYITEEETRFLDETSDLASLAIFEDEEPPKSAGLAPPTPNSVKAFLVPPEDGGSPKSIKSDNDIRQRRAQASKSTLARSPLLLAYAVIISVLVPILTFLVIPGFVERMVVVVLVLSGAVTAVAQSGLLKKLRDSQTVWDWALCGSIYGALMTFVAATCS